MAAADTEPQRWGDYMNKTKIIVVVVTIIVILVLTSKVAA